MVYNRPWYNHGVVQIDEKEFQALSPEVKQVFRKAVVR
jgi:TRAP-type C4-dicarboxylate transport system substrate-binding protein